MKLAYILLVHRDPELFGRLVRRLDNPGVTSFVVHIDQKVGDDTPFREQVKDVDGVYYAKRESGCWGGYSLVQATLNAIGTLVKEEVEFDYAIMMSGQDYPLKSNQYIHDFFAYSSGAQFMEAFNKDSGTKEWQKYLFGNRLENYYYRTIDGKRWYRYDGGSGYWRCNDARLAKGDDAWKPCEEPDGCPFDPEECRGPRKDHKPSIIKDWWGGSQWWALTKEAVQHIHTTVGKDNGYAAFHKYTFIPDENFFQSLILNSDRFGKRVINNRLRFIDFSDPNPKNMPKTFGDEDVSELKEFCSTEYPMMLFARKFDSRISARVLDAIDDQIKK